MTSEEFLAEHQKVVKQLLSGKLDIHRLKALAAHINVAVDSYSHCVDIILGSVKRFNRDIAQLCELRNLLLTEIKKLGVSDDSTPTET